MSKIISSVSSLVPFWANNVIIYLGIGSEYNMIFNIFLNEGLKYLEEKASHSFIYFLVALPICFLIANKLNLISSLLNYCQLVQPTTITISGSNATKSYPISMIALTNLFVEKYEIKSLILYKDTKFDVGVGELTNYQIDTGIFLTIKILPTGEITYTLKSFTQDLKKFVQNAIDSYSKLSSSNAFTLIGNETETTFQYPLTMIYITYALVNKYKMSRLVSKKMAEEKESIWSDHYKTEISTRDKNKINSAISNLFLVEEHKDYHLEDDLYITIQRSSNIIKYIIVSNKLDLKKFIGSCKSYFISDVSKNMFKFKIVISGSEIISDMDMKLNYSTEIFAINYRLVTEFGLSNYTILNRYSDEPVRYVLDDITTFEFDSILLTINRLSNTAGSRTYTVVDYVFESDHTDIEAFIKKSVNKYNEYLDTLIKNKIYHFTLTGFDSNSLPKFNSEILASDEIKLYETFDNIHSENSSLLIKDIEKLKNLDYYKRTGLKRKKSYLFYGEPGCGKTSSVVAMSLYDHRHIIDIPFSLISKNSQLENIMNMEIINQIPIKKSQVIYLFDEIDTGMNGMSRDTDIKLDSQSSASSTSESNSNSNSESNDLSGNVLTTLAVISALTNHNNNSDSSSLSLKPNDLLNIGKILSKFDGICNYDGLIIVATTNYKEKLDPALYRELRLTPIYFTFLRQIDAIQILEKFYQVKLTQAQMDLIPDRKITPAKLIFLCETHDDCPVDDLLETFNTL